MSGDPRKERQLATMGMRSFKGNGVGWGIGIGCGFGIGRYHSVITMCSLW